MPSGPPRRSAGIGRAPGSSRRSELSPRCGKGWDGVRKAPRVQRRRAPCATGSRTGRARAPPSGAAKVCALPGRRACRSQERDVSAWHGRQAPAADYRPSSESGRLCPARRRSRQRAREPALGAARGRVRLPVRSPSGVSASRLSACPATGGERGGRETLSWVTAAGWAGGDRPGGARGGRKRRPGHAAAGTGPAGTGLAMRSRRSVGQRGVGRDGEARGEARES